MHPIEKMTCNGLMNKVEEESGEYQFIKKGFLKGMGFMVDVTNIMAIHKNNVSTNLTKQASLDSFHIFSKAVSIKCGDDDDESHGVGISLSSANFSIDSAMSTVADENGLRHVLLCKVILGRVENVPVDSKQSQPSCRQYDTGVDDISSPRKHIIWTAFMNSHIHPEYIVSFNYNYVKDQGVFGTLKPQSEYVLLPNLVAKVSNHLKPSQMSLLLKSCRIYQEQKITRETWVNQVRKIVGDMLLHSVITDKSSGDVHPL
ncbi:probable inactive poly [ADP-ribose] polymerase SRO2 isoform X2 [Medicago truncatula]|uniref:probable inactive poly [ADP-ribose] polymerase SRO2 isoform X2 n=1 Tax=Medicago truncatula TaxID=3880 RepID=UPI000D2F354F|nr:probable inactive poly [ADP-ribose] polymerase SRO2 isoform X2 [Medicago truncatula]